MNAKDFQLYLEQPRLLYALPLADLQGLAMQYPYSPNLRMLLLLKTHLEGHPDEQAYLQRCATAAFDRAFVYDVLKDVRLLADEADARENNEVLELRTLEDIALEEDALFSDDSSENTLLENQLSYEQTPPGPDIHLSEDEDDDDAEEFFSLPVIPEPAPEAPPAPAYFASAEWVAAAAAYLGVLPAWPAGPAEATVVTPEPVSSFSGGKRPEPHGSLKDRLRSIRRRQSEKLADEQEEVRKIARRSLVSQEAVASETLASLLVRQGQYQRAIKMYRRLELLYPEKKTIFAGLIKDLQEKL